jgi:hypothetical protein
MTGLSVSALQQQARTHWEEMGQFTAPDTAPQDPDGRAVLYIAGFIAGYLARRSEELEGKA